MSKNREYKEKVLNYYGKPKKTSKARSAAKSVVKSVITKQFDDGRVLMIPSSNDRFREYDIMGRGASLDGSWGMQKTSVNFVEYDVVSKGMQANGTGREGYTSDLEWNEAYVEPFEEVSSLTHAQNARPVKERCSCNDHSNRMHGDPHIQERQTPASTQPNVAASSSDAVLPFESESKALSEDDLYADMKSILTGQKAFDPVTRKMVNKAEMMEQPRQQTQNSEPELKPLDQKSEHEIFDKIAQSMRFANAYDLGSISMEKRFQEFDELQEIKTNPAVKSNGSSTSQGQPRQQSHTTTEMPVVSSSDFIQDLDYIVKEDTRKKAQSQTALVEQQAEIPLDPGIGGMSIGQDALRPGDIILSTTRDVSSRVIRFGTGSEVSHAAVYIGDGKVIEAVGGGVLESTLANKLSHDTLAVAYRHIDMTPEKAALMIGFLNQAKDAQARYNYGGLVRVVPSVLANRICNALPAARQEACRAQARNLRLGTDSNDQFYCSELVLRSLSAAGISIADMPASSSSPNDFVNLNHNGTLTYVGHLKA
jgi:hypothetical protein